MTGERERWWAVKPRGLELPPLVGSYFQPHPHDHPAWPVAAATLAQVHGGPAQAAHAVLVWLSAAPSSEWSSDNSYVDTAFRLLERFGPEVLAAVLSAERDDKIWLAAARLLATQPNRIASPSALANHATRLHGLVSVFQPAWVHAIEQRLWPAPAPASHRRIEVLGQTRARSTVWVVDRSEDDGPVFVCDDGELVELSRQGRRVLARLDNMRPTVLVVDGRRLALMDDAAGRIIAIDRATGAMTVIAAGAVEHRDLRLLRLGTGQPPDGRLSWLTKDFPKGGDVIVRVLTEDGRGSVHTVTELIGAVDVSSHIPAADYFLLVTSEPCFPDRRDLGSKANLVMLDLAGRVAPLAPLVPFIDMDPVLVEAGFDAIFWSTGPELWACTHQIGNPRCLMKLPGSAIWLDTCLHGAVVLVRGADEVFMLCVSSSGAHEELARFPKKGAPWSVACSARQVTFGVGNEIARLSLSASG